MSILAINPGAYYHIESFEAPRYARFFDRLARPEDLRDTRLEDFSAVIIPCRTPADRLVPHKARLHAYLDAGGTLVVTGENAFELFLPGIRFTEQPTYWWWWLTPGADLGVRIAAPDHSLFRHLSQSDLSWHLHGWFDVPEGAEILAVNESGKPILYSDEVTTGGRMILTRLDPFYHHGSHFMPATTRFLDGFLNWLAEDISRVARYGRVDRAAFNLIGSEEI